VLRGVYRRIDAAPVFVEVRTPTDETLEAMLNTTTERLMKLLTRRG